MSSSIPTERLAKMSVEVRENAYCPYSKYKVGSAILTLSDSIFQGCNVENAGYGNTICAERHAIGTAITYEGPQMRIKAVFIASIDGKASPCGNCRQSINEFATDDCVVICVNKDGKIVQKFTHRELLPFAFGPHNLM